MSTAALETSQKTSLFVANASGRVYTINFDFSNNDQKEILRKLQVNGYTLYGFKGATGPNQVNAGLPVWFTQPTGEMFGSVEIDYEPLYKVYVFNKAVIGSSTVIRMEATSIELPLGTAVQFNADGTFNTRGDAAPGTITVHNGRPANTNNLTIGLAAYINGAYAPFCAFTSMPQGTISIAPKDTVCLFAGHGGTRAGSVMTNASTPGCTFDFNGANINYELEFINGTFGITNSGSGIPVTEFPAGVSLTDLLD